MGEKFYYIKQNNNTRESALLANLSSCKYIIKYIYLNIFSCTLSINTFYIQLYTESFLLVYNIIHIPKSIF